MLNEETEQSVQWQESEKMHSQYLLKDNLWTDENHSCDEAELDDISF